MEAAFLIQRDTRHRGEFNGNLFFLLVVGGGILSSLLLSPGHHFILVTIEPCEKVIELAKLSVYAGRSLSVFFAI